MKERYLDMSIYREQLEREAEHKAMLDMVLLQISVWNTNMPTWIRQNCLNGLVTAIRHGRCSPIWCLSCREGV